MRSRHSPLINRTSRSAYELGRAGGLPARQVGVLIGAVLLLGERHLRSTIAEFVAHSHAERNHQGLGNELIQPLRRTHVPSSVRWRERMGRMLNYYYRAA